MIEASKKNIIGLTNLFPYATDYKSVDITLHLSLPMELVLTVQLTSILDTSKHRYKLEQ